MTAFQYHEPKPPATLMREHISAMRVYARELQNVLGFDNPIVKRIYSCARSNENELDRWESSEAVWTRAAQVDRSPEGQDGETRLDAKHESAVNEVDAPKGSSK